MSTKIESLDVIGHHLDTRLRNRGLFYLSMQRYISVDGAPCEKQQKGISYKPNNLASQYPIYNHPDLSSKEERESQTEESRYCNCCRRYEWRQGSQEITGRNPQIDNYRNRMEQCSNSAPCFLLLFFTHLLQTTHKRLLWSKR